MPRRKNTRPTIVYWLVDTRTTTIESGWPMGKPFYCGKTVRPKLRMKEHRYAAARGGHLPVHHAVREVGDFIEFRIMESVSAGNDWVSREKSWVSTLRLVNPNCANVVDGGSGAPGLILSESHRQKLRLASAGRPKSPSELAAIGAAHRGKIVSEETRAKLRAANLGKKASDESRAKQSAALKGRKRAISGPRKPHSEATKEKIRLKLSGTKHSIERRANIGAAVKGVKMPPRSPEHCAKIAANKRAWHAARREASQNA